MLGLARAEPRAAPPPGSSRLRGAACLMAMGVATVMLVAVQRCFMAPSSSSAQLPQVPALAREASAFMGEDAGGQLAGLSEGDNVVFGSGMPLAGREFGGLQGPTREVKVTMFNKKRGRRDRSEGWTFRKKFRSCSLLARAATVKGRKILKRRRKRGRHQLATGDYINPKMLPVGPLR